jgi:hypothetical protein
MAEIIFAVAVVAIIGFSSYAFYQMGKRAGAEEAWRTIRETRDTIKSQESKRQSSDS